MSNLISGRINQKLRTRDLLIDIAKELLRKGENFSVAEVARIARVGRATAYEYFPTQAHLVAQTILRSVGDIDFDDKFDRLFSEHKEPEIRVAAVVKVSDDSIRSHGGEYRAMLRMSLEQHSDTVPHRSKFRVEWLERALETLESELSKQKFRRLVAALGLCVGIEPAVVLQDVFGLSRDEAREVKLWAASALLQCALREARSPRRNAPGRKLVVRTQRSKRKVKQPLK